MAPSFSNILAELLLCSCLIPSCVGFTSSVGKSPGAFHQTPSAFEWWDCWCAGHLLSCSDYVEFGCCQIHTWWRFRKNCSQSVKHVNYIPVTFKKFLAEGEVLSERHNPLLPSLHLAAVRAAGKAFEKSVELDSGYCASRSLDYFLILSVPFSYWAVYD